MKSYSNGLGSFGLPGDYSSGSRFVRAAYVKFNSVSDGTHSGDITQFFQILDSVSMPRGCVEIAPKEFEITRYSSCCNTDTGVYYYTTYQNKQITAVDMHRTNLNDTKLTSYPLIVSTSVHQQN
jgi:choloylglycine hydrolase